MLFQVAGGKSICPGFLYARSNSKTLHLFNRDRVDVKQGYIQTLEDGEIKHRRFKEDMMLLNLRLHRAIDTDDVSYGQLCANKYPQGVHWERNVKKTSILHAKSDAYIVHFNCTVGWSNLDEMHANNIHELSYHDKKIWNMLRYDMWYGDVSSKLDDMLPVSYDIITCKPGPLTEAYRSRRRRRK